MKVAVDTNVLVYAEGINDAERGRIALNVLNSVVPLGAAVAVQTLGELFHVLGRKGRYTPERARTAVAQWTTSLELIGTTAETFSGAMDLATAHRLSIWDAIIVSAAASAGCRMLLSEDLQDGFSWAGVTVVNPFASNPHPLLASLLAK